jgi:2'-5' RNA ligase
MRLFVSVDLDGLTERVAAVQELFDDADGLRYTDPEQAHLTLKFLGDVDETDRPTLRAAIGEAVTESGVSPFKASFGGLGVFPHLDYISVVWLGVDGGEASFTALHDAIESRVTDLGYDPEDHEFTPHVTLARMKHAGSKGLIQDLVTRHDPDAGAMTVEELRLKSSTLTGDGPEYSTVERFVLSD